MARGLVGAHATKRGMQASGAEAGGGRRRRVHPMTPPSRSSLAPLSGVGATVKRTGAGNSSWVREFWWVGACIREARRHRQAGKG